MKCLMFFLSKTKIKSNEGEKSPINRITREEKQEKCIMQFVATIARVAMMLYGGIKSLHKIE